MPNIDNAHIVMPTIELQTHNEKAALQLKSIEKYGDGSGYGCELFVRSGGFTAECPFFFDSYFLSEALKQLKEMERSFQGDAVLRQLYEEGHIKISINRYGQVTIAGKIIEYTDKIQTLEFTFRTDQTILRPLIQDLTQLIES